MQLRRGALNLEKHIADFRLHEIVALGHYGFRNLCADLEVVNVAYFESFSRRKGPEEPPRHGIRCIVTGELERLVKTPERVECITDLDALKAFYMPFYKDASGRYFEPPVHTGPYPSDGVRPLRVTEMAAGDHPDFPIKPVHASQPLEMPAFRLNGEIILLDGNHKAVGLVRENETNFQIELTIVDLPPDLVAPHKIHPGLLIFYRHFGLVHESLPGTFSSLSGLRDT